LVAAAGNDHLREEKVRLVLHGPISAISDCGSAGKYLAHIWSASYAHAVNKLQATHMDHALKIQPVVAAKAATLPEADQREIAEKATAEGANAARTVAKQKARKAKEAKLGLVQTALPVKKYAPRI
jgi:hypothetical protein